MPLLTISTVNDNIYFILKREGKRSKINEQELVRYIEDLDHVFSRLISRLRFLFNKYTTGEITATQLAVLRILNEKGASNTSFLADSLGVTLSAITAMVNRLNRLDMVSRERRLKDRRQVWIKITPKGRTVLEEVEERRYFLLSIFFARYPQKDREYLLKAMHEVVSLFEREDILDEEV